MRRNGSGNLFTIFLLAKRQIRIKSMHKFGTIDEKTFFRRAENPSRVTRVVGAVDALSDCRARENRSDCARMKEAAVSWSNFHDFSLAPTRRKFDWMICEKNKCFCTSCNEIFRIWGGSGRCQEFASRKTFSNSIACLEACPLWASHSLEMKGKQIWRFVNYFISLPCQVAARAGQGRFGWSFLKLS